jgi:probable F420-dependent oxidoreductase
MGGMRFLANAAPELYDAAHLTDYARRAESMGFSGLAMPDHLLQQHAVVPVLAHIAAKTERIRIGSFVFNNELRHPAVLAQDLATLDVLSGGRLDVGMGAGWNKPEHDSIGLPFAPVGERVARLTEAIAVLKGYFGDSEFSYDGAHYTIRSLNGEPKPVQRPHPPFFIGGGGKRLLTLAGREAQIVGLAPRLLPGPKPQLDPSSITMAAAEEKVGWVRDAADGRPLEINTYPTAPITITNSAREAAAGLAAKHSLTVEEVLESPHIFIGSVDSLVEKMSELEERLGVTSVMTGAVDALAPVVERLAVP